MMKEFYISPELKLLCFAAGQKLASVNFDDLLNPGTNNGPAQEANPSDTDIPMDINL